jgi:allantoicase
MSEFSLDRDWVNLAAVQFGGNVLHASNEWFANADNLLKEGRGDFDPDAFTLNVTKYDFDKEINFSYRGN